VNRCGVLPENCAVVVLSATTYQLLFIFPVALFDVPSDASMAVTAVVKRQRV
jgi:hypothetical protein